MRILLALSESHGFNSGHKKSGKPIYDLPTNSHGATIFVTNNQSLKFLRKNAFNFSNHSKVSGNMETYGTQSSVNTASKISKFLSYVLTHTSTTSRKKKNSSDYQGPIWITW